MVNHGSESKMNNNVENELDLLEEEVAKSLSSKMSKPSTQANSHLLTGPLLTGLGVNVSNSQDMERMQALSEELGRSLQSCIKGLLQLNQQVVQGSFDALGRNLQPIEDNPLRLGLSYEDTVHTMYDTEKSPVHLSAPAAITESLQQICRHNIAMQFATTQALNHILQAFAPEVLLKRFHHYKRNIDGAAQSEDAWAWQMYSHYYRELTSHRQSGFEKLFWEVFEQAYDKKIREQQMDTNV